MDDCKSNSNYYSTGEQYGIYIYGEKWWGIGV